MKKRVLVCLLIALCAWFGQYRRINQFYQSHTLAETRYCRLGEELVYKGWKGSTGCSCTVTGFEVTQCEPDSCLFWVDLTLSNPSGAARSPDLSDFALYGANTTQPLDLELLAKRNPCVDDAMRVTLPQGESCELSLPFVLYAQDYRRSTWKHLDKLTFYLSVPASALCQYVLLNRRTP